MGDMRVKIDEGLLTKLENLAHSHNRSLEEQVNDLLRAALEDGLHVSRSLRSQSASRQ